MNTEEPFYLRTLRDHFDHRCRIDRSYSLRAFARELKIGSSTLSAILREKRPLPIARANDISAGLDLSPRDQTRFLESVMRQRLKLPELPVQETWDSQVLRDDLYFHVLAEWEHYAVLSLMDIRGFRPDYCRIALRLGISEQRAATVWKRLVDLGLVAKDAKGNFRKSTPHIKTSEDVPSLALRKSHRETLEMAIKKLASVPIDLRDFSSRTLAVNLRKMKEAKEAIRKFRSDMAALLEDGEQSEVFQLAVAFYPLTETSSIKTSRFEKKEYNK